MENATYPLRLAAGTHEAGTGKGCAMNAISWENGDITLTDMPSCADEVLAHIVQDVNDNICAHRDEDLLCPTCSMLVLNLAYRIVGTGTHPLTALERQQVWVRVAADQARQVLHLVDGPDALVPIEAAEAWAAAPCEERWQAAWNAVKTDDTAHRMSYAARCAEYAASCAALTVVIGVLSPATASTAYTNAADALPDDRLRLAHRAVDVWCEKAGFAPTFTDAPGTEQTFDTH
jgi:hypothetical protein